MTSLREAAIAIVAWCAFATNALQAAGPKPGSWQLEITPYLFGSALSGTAGVANVRADVDLSFGDILEGLDSGFLAMCKARKGRGDSGAMACIFV